MRDVASLLEGTSLFSSIPPRGLPTASELAMANVLGLGERL
jgi:hypothetical protein